MLPLKQRTCKILQVVDSAQSEKEIIPGHTGSLNRVEV